MDAYADFLARKRLIDPMTGIAGTLDLPDFFKPHQRDITQWALRRGRAAIFAGTGLGKTLMELVWAREVARETRRPVLILAPLAVSQQHGREAQKFGLQASIVTHASGGAIDITNYQKLDRFDLDGFGGVALDESSILKNVDGKTRSKLIEDCARLPFRLAATATPAPNDYMELGNHAEFLGVMRYTDMLATFFTHDGGDTRAWRLKGHAEHDFWRWMASWAVMLRKPSDLGYSDDGYDLPPLHYHHHRVAVDFAPSFETGTLFPMEARTLRERLTARKESVGDRVAKAKEIVFAHMSAKVAEWHGNPNTPATGETKQKPIPNTGPSETPRATDKTPKQGLNTCANTAPKSLKNTSEHQNSRHASTQGDGNSTQPTPTIGKRQRGLLDQDLLKADVNNSCPNSTDLRSNNMTTSCGGREEDAPYAARLQQAAEEKDSPSTIATTQVSFEEFSAATAIRDSESSRTVSGSLIEQSNTCLTHDPWVIWCHLNNEQDALETAFGALAFSIRGSQSEKEQMRLYEAWLRGDRPILICKPSMFGFGLNWQHCCNTIFIGLNDSWEQVFQAIRRFWRFGQTREVHAHFIASEREGAVVANFRRKDAQAEHMAAQMVAHMADLSSAEVRGMVRDRPDYAPAIPMQIPTWMEAA